MVRERPPPQKKYTRRRRFWTHTRAASAPLRHRIPTALNVVRGQQQQRGWLRNPHVQAATGVRERQEKCYRPLLNRKHLSPLTRNPHTTIDAILEGNVGDRRAITERVKKGTLSRGPAVDTKMRYRTITHLGYRLPERDSTCKFSKNTAQRSRM